MRRLVDGMNVIERVRRAGAHVEAARTFRRRPDELSP
jgi:hypothetical protein